MHPQAQADTIRNQPNRTILGTEQLEWIRDSTKASVSSKTTWQLYGQDTVMLEQ
jgi:phosphodiesterase/alkaline phosphatase D-like protein